MISGRLLILFITICTWRLDGIRIASTEQFDNKMCVATRVQGPDVPIVLVGGGAERSKVAQALSSLTSRPIKVVQGNVQEAVAAGTAVIYLPTSVWFRSGLSFELLSFQPAAWGARGPRLGVGPLRGLGHILTHVYLFE